VQDGLTIVEAAGARLVKAFVELPYRLYAGHPHWIPELRRDMHRRLSPRHNPFLAHADMKLFLAMRSGRVCGRVAAIEDHAHNEFHHERLAWFGFFEAEDAATASALLNAAGEWGRRRGCSTLRGPANPSLNESCGLLIDGFDDDPYLLMPYNPPVYAQYVEAAGFAKVKDLWAWDFDIRKPVGERIARMAARVTKRHNVTVRHVNMRDYDADLARMVSVYRAAWEANWGFVPPTDAEMKQLATDLKPIVDPDGRQVAAVRPLSFPEPQADHHALPPGPARRASRIPQGRAVSAAHRRDLSQRLRQRLRPRGRLVDARRQRRGQRRHRGRRRAPVQNVSHV
jgi:hypothetical protein